MEKPQITTKRIRKNEPTGPSDPIAALYADLPNAVPYNVSPDAISWYEATAWANGHILGCATGEVESDAIRNLYILLHKDEIAEWQK